MGFEERDRLTAAERRLAELETRTARLPVRPASVGDGSDAIVFYAYVDQLGWVDNTSATFSFDDATGQGAPGSGTGTAYNKFSLPLSDNDLVLIVEVEGEYWALRPGEGAAAEMFVGRLTGDLAPTAVSGTAKPIDSNGDVISAADPVYMVDTDLRWHGLAPYNDLDTAAAAHPGSLVAGVKFTDNYDSSGYPGYWIIDCETWVETIVVALTDVVSTGTATCDIQDPGLYGAEAAGRYPIIYSDDYDLLVHDDYDVAGDALAGDLWVAMYSHEEGHYVFIEPLGAETDIVIFRCKTTTDILGATPFSSASSSFATVFGDLPTADPISVTNPLGLYVAAGKWVTVVVKSDGTYEAINAQDHVDTWLRAQSGYSAGSQQLFVNDGGTFKFTDIATVLNWLASYTAGNDQTIGHPASSATVWEDNDTSCP